MDKLKYGETIVLETGEEYICISDIIYNDDTYAYLISKAKPYKTIFAKEVFNNGIGIEIITDDEILDNLFKLFISKVKGD